MNLADDIARTLVKARAEWRPLPEIPGTPPRSLAEAYAIQDCAVRRLGSSIVGWKVGSIAPALTPRLRADRFCGPLTQVYDGRDDSSGPVAVGIIAGGFAAIEAELVVRIAKPFRSGAAVTSITQVHEFIDAIHVGVEIAGSPMPRIVDYGPIGAVADHGNSLGVVVGRTLSHADWQALSPLSVEVHVAGELVGTGGPDNVPGGLWAALSFVFGNLSARGFGLRTGDWVSTGAMTGVHPIEPGQRASVVFGHESRIEIEAKAGTSAPEVDVRASALVQP